MSNQSYPYYEVPTIVDLNGLIKYGKEHWGDRLCIWFRNKNDYKRITYQQFADDVEALRAYFTMHNYHRKHIGLLSENSYAWIITYFAVVNSGNVIVPFDKEMDHPSIKRLAEHSDIVLLIHSEKQSANAEDICECKIVTSQLEQCMAEGRSWLATPNHSAFPEIVLDDMAAIVYTSGTTGEPKGVMLSHRNLMTDALISLQNLNIPEGTVAVLPFNHTFGWMACVMVQLVRGYPIFLNQSLRQITSDLQAAHPKHISVVPVIVAAFHRQIFDSIRKKGKERLVRVMMPVCGMLRKVGIDIRRKVFAEIHEAFGGQLEMIITGGSAIDERYVRDLDALGFKVTSGYGITECSPIVTTMRNKHYCPSSVGTIQNGIQYRFADGELQLKGDIVFAGYYKDRKLTEEAFDGDWFRTGDLGHLDQDGLLHLTGRCKNLIILSNGKNVSPEELEDLLLSSIPEIAEVVVSAQDDRICAEVFPDLTKPDVEKKIQDAVKKINQELPPYKQINLVEFRNVEFPKTSIKKIKRHY